MPQWIVTTQKNKQQKTVATVGILLLSVFCFAILLFGFVNSANASVISVNTTSEIIEGLEMIEEPLGLPSMDIRTIIANIIRVALSLVGIILVVIIMYGGFLYMTAGGNEEQIGRAKDILKNAVIGLAIILSAYAIVLFIMKMLGVGIGGPSKQTISLDGYQNFRGSGALGRIVKDHYPMRDQTDVYRNTKIVVTFRLPVEPSSFIINTNGSFNDINANDQKDSNEPEIFGDCIGSGDTKVCDTLNTEAIEIEAISGNEGITLVQEDIVVLTQPTTSTVGNYGVHTIVLKPASYLGSSLEDVQYKVKLNDKILLDNPNNPNKSAFSTVPAFYEWRFTCGTEIDLTPPYVINTWPKDMDSSPKNTVIQVVFNEAIDPTGIQGMFSLENNYTLNYFKLSGNNIFLKNDDEMLPVGNMNLTGGYRVLEFTPTEACGTNVCGGQIFCLPIATTTESSKYELVLKAGEITQTDNWEADAFTGVMDMASNALDGNHDGKIQHATTTLPVFNNWLNGVGKVYPDNYGFTFQIENRIDLTPPYLNQISPGLDDIDVGANREWSLLFSKRMRVEPLYDIGITEHPDPLLNEDDATGQCAILKAQLEAMDMGIDTSFDCVHEYLWKAPKTPVFFAKTPEFSTGQTEVEMRHGEFLDKMRQYYFPFVTSTVEDVNFNCFYPGKGPGELDRVYSDGTLDFYDCGDGSWTDQGCEHLDKSWICAQIEDLGIDKSPDFCTGVTTTPSRSFGCNGLVGDIVSTTESCNQKLKDLSLSAGTMDPPSVIPPIIPSVIPPQIDVDLPNIDIIIPTEVDLTDNLVN